ncbi:MAG TPA: TetR family transcriptional regulator [Candidatus Nanopelagicales bacterium]|nr:TetR family transcriptional regulator [Candidatus Nanopelagicales bacterium]
MAVRGRRPSGSTDTRQAILDAARELFAEKGFERTTMRAVGERAGVDPALIAYWFGSKDGLLAEAMTLPLDIEAVLADLDASRPGADIVRRVLAAADGSPAVRGRAVAFLRIGLSHDHVAGLLREVISRRVLATLSPMAAPDHRELRAALIGSHIAGLMMGRYVVRVPALADADSEQLVVAMAPVVQHYLTGPMATVPERGPARRRAR